MARYKFYIVLYCTCTVPPTRRPRAHHRVNLYPARRQNGRELFSDHDETSPSIAAVSAPSAACSMLVVQQLHHIVDDTWNNLVS